MADSARDGPDVGRRQRRAPAQARAEALAAEVFHHEVRGAAVDSEVEHLDDVRAAKRRGFARASRSKRFTTSAVAVSSASMSFATMRTAAMTPQYQSKNEAPTVTAGKPRRTTMPMESLTMKRPPAAKTGSKKSVSELL